MKHIAAWRWWWLALRERWNRVTGRKVSVQTIELDRLTVTADRLCMDLVRNGFGLTKIDDVLVPRIYRVVITTEAGKPTTATIYCRTE